MNWWRRLLRRNGVQQSIEATKLVYEQFPPITAIVLCDNEPITNVYAVIKGYLALWMFLLKEFFPNDDPGNYADELIKESMKMRCQILVSVDEHANIYSKEEREELQKFCTANQIDFVKSLDPNKMNVIIKGYSKGQHYADALIHAWGLYHLLSDIQLTDTIIPKLVSVLPSSILADEPSCFASKKEDGKYHIAIVGKGDRMFSIDDYSFHDFCAGIIRRLKEEGRRVREFSL